ncbi:MAG: trypsin-like peptidase domain-containing protein [Rhodobacteraceae bacterium]|nr:trypsin-like peptidase domain-containing protein [Paracoccaceae bacterium]
MPHHSAPVPGPVAAVFRALVLGFLVALAGPVRAAEPEGAALTDALHATLVIRTADGGRRLLGSAFLWGDDGLAVTNAHVVGTATRVLAVFSDGRSREAEVIARDDVRDIAVLSFGESMGRGLRPAETTPALGQSVWAFGAPLGIEFTLTQGMISHLGRQVEANVPILMLQHDAAVNPGSSGGPLVDAAGRLVGMNSRIADGSRLFVGMGFAIPAAELARLVPALVDGTLDAMPQLGLRARPVDARLARALDWQGGGLLVDHVEAGGLADRAGILPGDILVAVDGRAIGAAGDLAFLVEAALPAREAWLDVRRAGAGERLLLDLEPPRMRLSPVGIGNAPSRVTGYSLERLGITLDDEGRITRLTANSLAALAGVAEGDLLLALNGAALDSPAAVAAARELRIEEPAVILVRRADGSTQHVVIDPWEGGRGLRPVGGANVLDPDVVVF